MGDTKTPLLFLLLLIPIAGCSLALDFDSLSGGGKREDSDPVDPNACVVDRQCDDNIDCTTDTCNNYQCYRVPDNSKCAHLEMCSRELGCVPTGKECLIGSDCDDSIHCTIDECANGKCRNLPDNSRCVDTENLCVTGRICELESGCSAGQVTGCDQSQAGPCKTNVCQPITGECQEVLVAGADDDNDSFLDVSCGGNDCADNNPNVNPAATEVCNLADDNCDGITDIKAIEGPLAIMQASELYAPELASDGSHFALTWQRGEGESASVYAQLLGTGSCLTKTVCDDPSSQAASEIINLTPKGGGTSTGTEPSIGFGNGEFVVAWSAREPPGDPRLMAVGIKRVGDGSSLDLWTEAKRISSATAQSVIRASSASTSDNSRWMFVWAAGFENTQVALEFADSEMISNSEAPLQIALNQNDVVESVAIDALGTTGAIVAYSLRSATSDGDAEIYEARLDLSGNTWGVGSGWPKLISLRDASKTDPSRQPAVTSTGAESWVVAFSDIRAAAGDPENETDIRAVRSEEPGSVKNLFQDTIFEQFWPAIDTLGDQFGLSYIQDVSSGQTLDFRLLNANLSRYEKQGGRFVHLQNGKLISSGLLAHQNGFALAWVESPETGDDTLKFISFEGCTPDAP